MSAPTVNPSQFGFAPPHNLLVQKPLPSTGGVPTAPGVAPAMSQLGNFNAPPVAGMGAGSVATTPSPFANAAMAGQNASNPSGSNGMFPINNTPPPAVEPTIDPTQFAIQHPMQPTTSDGVPTSLPGIRPTGVAPPAPKIPLPAGHQMAINRLRGVGHHSRPY